MDVLMSISLCPGSSPRWVWSPRLWWVYLLQSWVLFYCIAGNGFLSEGFSQASRETAPRSGPLALPPPGPPGGSIFDH